MKQMHLICLLMIAAQNGVMGQNELFDTDGSDAMVDYLNKASVVDSLNKLEQ